MSGTAMEMPVLDELAEDQDLPGGQDEEDTEIPSGHRHIFTDKLDPPIQSLFLKYKSGDLVLDPIFQRRPVWDTTRSSRLIESVLLEVPIPVFYLAESPDDTEEVIDGQQRLRAFFDFIDGKYALRNLKALPHLNGQRYGDLGKAAQKKFDNYSVRTVVFKKESDDDLRFSIFERLNAGAVPLNAQELRNCVYRGPYNELLLHLSEDPDYMAVMGLEGPEKRMRDVEYALRFAAFYHATYLNYRPSMAQFLNEDMRRHQNIVKTDADALRAAFKNSVTLVRSLLGTNAFRRYYRGDEGTHDGHWEPKQFNASLYDILMWSLAGRDKNQVMANLDAIREAWIALMTDDPLFIESIERSTSSLKSVIYRFDAWRKALDEILATSTKQARTFTRELKSGLYAKNPVCGICKQHIAELDDAAVDHVEQYWLGGKTIQTNARLAHRYCNWARPKQDPS